METGNLVIYDETGKIFPKLAKSRRHTSSCVPCRVTADKILFRTMIIKKLISGDVSTTP